MWKRLAIVGVLVACGAKDRVEPGDAIEYAGDVDLATQPTTEWVGLPMSGVVHVEVHLQHAKPDLSKATGTIRLSCEKGIQLGDDKAKLVLKTRRASAFVGDGLDFGHVAFGSFDIGIALENGTATITSWNVASPDVQLVATGSVKLGRTLADSSVDLCLRFGATPALQQRSPKTAAVIELTGAPRSAKDGLFNIQLADRYDHVRRLGRVCDGSPPQLTAPKLLPVSPEPPQPPPAGPEPSPPPPAPDPASDADTAALIAAAIKQTSESSFDVDATKWAQLLANPTAIAKGARVGPAMKDGKAVGFKLYAIRPSSLVAHLGLVNGDTITSIAGETVASADKALEVYTKLRDAKVGDSVKVTVDRKGVTTTLSYTLR